MSGKPIFSVVIPVYNVAPYISTCLNSVLAQSFSSFEIVCVNDGSTDNSVAIIQSYNDPRIRIIHQQNKGLAAARNTGINHSQGLYIALLDSDDFWLPEKLAKHFQHFKADPLLDVSYSASLFVDEDSRYIGLGQHPKTEDISPADIFCRNPVGNGSAAVMRRSFLQHLRKWSLEGHKYRYQYFDESLRQSEDIEFWLRAALDANAKFAGIKEALTCYRVNSSGLSANLERQYQTWQQGIAYNQEKHAEFFKRWLPVATAYQQRYLARRAVQTGNAKAALSWIHKAIFNHWRIITQEPVKTIETYLAALACALPKPFYNSLQQLAINAKALTK